MFVRLLSFVCNRSLSLDSCWLSFEVLLSFLSALLSFQASLSFKSYLVRSTPLIRLKASLFRGTPADFRWKSFFRFSMLFLFFSGLSFVPVLSCSFESSHWFATSHFRWTPAGFRSKYFFRFSLLFFRLRALFRSSPVLFVRLLHSFEILALSLDSSRLSFEVLRSSLYALLSFQASLSFKPWFGLRRVGAYALMDWSGALSA